MKKSHERVMAESDPTWAPHCGVCKGPVPMAILEPFLWRCTCGNHHDERAGASLSTKQVQSLYTECIHKLAAVRRNGIGVSIILPTDHLLALVGEVLQSRGFLEGLRDWAKKEAKVAAEAALTGRADAFVEAIEKLRLIVEDA